MGLDERQRLALIGAIARQLAEDPAPLAKLPDAVLRELARACDPLRLARELYERGSRATGPTTRAPKKPVAAARKSNGKAKASNGNGKARKPRARDPESNATLEAIALELMAKERIAVGDLMKEGRAERKNAARVLYRLVKNGKVLQTGKNRATRYYLPA